MRLESFWSECASRLPASSPSRPVRLIVGGAFTGKSTVIQLLGHMAGVTLLDGPSSEILPKIVRACELNEDVVAAVRPRDVADLRARGLVRKCSVRPMRRVTHEHLTSLGLSETNAAELIVYTGGNPKVIELFLSEWRADSTVKSVSRDLWIEMQEAFRCIHDSLGDDEREAYYSLLSSGGTLPLTYPRGTLLFESLDYAMIASPESEAFVATGNGFLAWVRDCCLGSSSLRKSTPGVFPTNGGGKMNIPILEEQIASILHVSDVQFGPKNMFGGWDVALRHLVDDLGRLRGYGIRKPDIIVLSGDIAEAGMPEEYEQAERFIDGLLGFLEISSQSRVVVVAGNHDVCWPLSRGGSSASELRRFRFAPFADFVRSRYVSHVGDGRRMLPSVEHGYMEFPEFGVGFGAFDTCDREDHENHEGWLAPDQLRAVGERLGAASLTRIAVMHHGPLAHANKQDVLSNAVDVRRALQINNYHICLHGHVHEGSLEMADEVMVLAAGSLNVVSKERPVIQDMGQARNQYNLIILGPGSETTRRRSVVYTRVYDPFLSSKRGRGRWTGGCFPDSDDDRWWKFVDLRE